MVATPNSLRTPFTSLIRPLRCLPLQPKPSVTLTPTSATTLRLIIVDVLPSSALLIFVSISVFA